MDAGGGGDATAATAGGWWGAAPQASADVMNQLCRVCGEPAAGFHFGAFTCEGCKSFFGRTYNNLSSISECKNNGECVINKKNRTSCKACRLRKCLLVGMSKSGSRYGRRSNWFKLHCLMQEQRQQHQDQQLQPPLESQRAAPAGGGVLPKQKAPLWGDAANNNLPPLQQQQPPPPASPASVALRGFSQHYGPQDAAALWAARSALLLGPHQHQHQAFGLPFLPAPFQQAPSPTGGESVVAAAAAAAAAFYHSPSSHRNLFLPFVQSLQPPRPLVQQERRTPFHHDSHALEPRLSSSSSCSSSASSPLQRDSCSTSKNRLPKCGSPHEEQKAVALLLSEPEQDQPIDLSVKAGETCEGAARSSPPGCSFSASGSSCVARDRGSECSSKDDSNSGDPKDVDGANNDSISQTKVIRTPLDLTTRS